MDAVEPQIRALWEEDMPATVIAERIGRKNSLTVVKDRVRVRRPQYEPADRAARTTCQPGEPAQCDLWFPPVKIPVRAGQMAGPPVPVVVNGYSRWLMARTSPLRAAVELFAGMWMPLRVLGRLSTEPTPGITGESGAVPPAGSSPIWQRWSPLIPPPRPGDARPAGRMRPPRPGDPRPGGVTPGRRTGWCAGAGR